MGRPWFFAFVFFVCVRAHSEVVDLNVVPPLGEAEKARGYFSALQTSGSFIMMQAGGFEELGEASDRKAQQNLMKTCGINSKHRWSGAAWTCSGKCVDAANKWGDCLGESVLLQNQPFLTTGTNPLPSCATHTGNANHVTDAAFDAKTDCAAGGAGCTTWSRRCKCSKSTTSDCLAPNFSNKAMSEAWIFQAHVNKAAITTVAIQQAVTDKIGLNYAAWQNSRGATLAAAAEEESLGEITESLTARRRKAAATTSTTSASCTGTDWTFPSGVAYVSTADEAIVVNAMTAALSAKGLAAKSSMKVNAVGGGNMPAAGEEAQWGIKCGTMYAGCGAACGIIAKMQHVGRGSCSISNADKIVFVKMGRVTVPASGSFTMPSHKKMVVGWVARGSDAALNTGCTGAEKKKFLSDVDSALREGVAKARFTISKSVMAQIAARSSRI